MWKKQAKDFFKVERNLAGLTCRIIPRNFVKVQKLCEFKV